MRGKVQWDERVSTTACSISRHGSKAKPRGARLLLPPSRRRSAAERVAGGRRLRSPSLAGRTPMLRTAGWGDGVSANSTSTHVVGRPPPGPASQAHPPRHPTSLRYAGREGGLETAPRRRPPKSSQTSIFANIKTWPVKSGCRSNILRPRKDFPLPNPSRTH